MAKDRESTSSSGGFSLRQILQKHEEQLMDFEQNICLLCKRKFTNTDQIKRHRSLSKLHSSRLVRLRRRLFSGEQLDRIERKEREALYRDRAKERRLKYGQPDRVIPLEPKLPSSSGGGGVGGNSSSFNESMGSATTKSSQEPLGLDNRGALLMSKMGWREGTGLGKSSDGRVDIVKLESHVGTSGLGSKPYRVDPNLSYREAVKRVMHQRYRELSSGDEDDDEGDDSAEK